MSRCAKRVGRWGGGRGGRGGDLEVRQVVRGGPAGRAGGGRGAGGVREVPGGAGGEYSNLAKSIHLVFISSCG